MPTGTVPLGRLGASLAQSLADMATGLQAATVHVYARAARGSGSGVIWRADGLIVTNAHCVAERRVGVDLPDGRAFDARVVASDPRRDLALLAISAAGLPAATPGDPMRLRAGELVFAAGSPWGLSGAVTLGVVHTGGGGTAGPEPNWIRADIRLAPGNSGGPLADARGRIVGINTLIAYGLALAVPATAVERFVRRVAEEIARGEPPEARVA